MHFKWPLLGFVGLTLFSFTLLAIIHTDTSTTLSPGDNQLEACKTLTYHGEHKINLVFFGDGKTVKKYMDYFFSVKPFTTRQEDFNVYYIDDYKPTCTRYRGIALLCYNKEVIEKAGSCPSADAILVLSSDKESIRSSAYLGVGSLNTNHPYSVFAHEFGHLFGNFAEEYRTETLPANQQNCKASQSDFTSPVDGIYQECSKQSYYRSIESGFMRSLEATQYGQYNEHLLEAQIDNHYSPLKATGFASQEQENCAAESYYLAEAKYDGTLTPIDTYITNGCAQNQQAGSFSYIGSDGREVSTFEPILFTDGPGRETIDGEDFKDPDLPVYIPLPLSTPPQLSFHDDEGNFIGQMALSDAGARLCKI